MQRADFSQEHQPGDVSSFCLHFRHAEGERNGAAQVSIKSPKLEDFNSPTVLLPLFEIPGDLLSVSSDLL